MAVVSLQVSPSCELCWGSKPGPDAGGRLRQSDRRNSVPVSSPGVGAGGRGVTRSFLVCEDSILSGLSKGQSLGKSLIRANGNCPGWWRGRWSWSNNNRKKKEIVSAVDGGGHVRSGETARDINSKRFSRGDDSKEFFVDQGYEYGTINDFLPGDPTPDDVRGVVNGRVGNLIPGEEDLEERSDVQGEANRRKQRARSREWVQLDERRGRREPYGSGANRGANSLVQDDDTYAWENVPATASRKENDGALGKTTQVGLYEESLEEDRQFLRSPFIEYERDGDNYQNGRASGDSIRLGQAREPAGENEEAVAESPRSLGRDGTGYQRKSGSRSDLRETSVFDGDKLDRRRLVPDTRRQNRAGEYLDDDDQAHMRRAEETRENSPFQRDAQRGNLDAPRGEERWQSSSRAQAESGPSNPTMESRSGNRESANSASVLRKGPNDDDMSSRRGLPAEEWELETGKGNWGRVLTRGTLYAKQVISQATAQNLGVVTQLLVDIESFKVVAVEVRPNLLFGSFDSILLNNLSKVGDVILIHDENAILDDLNLFNCSDLVGNDLFTENGFCLGKVRDYDFSLEDGAVLSLEFDTFGVPLIPSTVISTYSLTADEVIEAQEDSLLIRKGAEKRVRKLTKGLFSRPKQPSRRWHPPQKEWEKRTPQLIPARSSAAPAAGEQYTGSSIGQEREGVGGVLQRDEYSPKFSPPGEQLKRESIYSQDRRKVLGDTSLTNKLEIDQAQDIYPKRSFSFRKEYFPPEKLEVDRDIPPSRKELSIRDVPQILDSKEPQVRGPRTSAPEVNINSRGLPMSYTTSKRRVENDG